MVELLVQHFVNFFWAQLGYVSRLDIEADRHSTHPELAQAAEELGID